MSSISLPDLGMILNLLSVVLLAVYGIPNEPLYPDGGDNAGFERGEPYKSDNIKKYKKHRRITYIAYGLLFVGFLLQLQLLQKLL